MRRIFLPQAEGQLLIESSSDEEEEDNGGDDNDATNKEGGGVSPRSSGGLIDVEDMGKMVKKMKAAAKKRQEEEEGRVSGGEPREMVTPMLHKALTKQGRSDHTAQYEYFGIAYSVSCILTHFVVLLKPNWSYFWPISSFGCKYCLQEIASVYS